MSNRTSLILKLAKQKGNSTDYRPTPHSHNSVVCGNEWTVINEEEIPNTTPNNEVQAIFQTTNELLTEHIETQPISTILQTREAEPEDKTQGYVDVIPKECTSKEVHSEENHKPSTSKQCVSEFSQNTNKSRECVPKKLNLPTTSAQSNQENVRPKRKCKTDNEATGDLFSDDPNSENDYDVDDSDEDPNYEPKNDLNFPKKQTISNKIFNIPRRNKVVVNTKEKEPEIFEENDNVFEFLEQNNTDLQKKKGKKRSLNKDNWLKCKAKKLRNSGEEYKSSSKSRKLIEKKEIKPPCNDRCRIQCKTKINPDERQTIFKNYWALGDLSRQRDFIASHIQNIQPTYQYKREGNKRKPNQAFYFDVADKRVRVCKDFFRNTLGINDRPIRTVIDKKDASSGFVAGDLRGKHDKHQTDQDKLINEGIRRHIESIPKIESHYLRANTTREFIEGGKTISDLHRDYVEHCKSLQKPHGNYKKYYDIFTKEYNISFFVPKKDLCELCHAYETAEGERKTSLQEEYEKHIMEKDLSRLKKNSDKDSVSVNTIVACYDLQAVLQCPKGEVSLMYYKSKLNMLNLTVCELKNDAVFCYTWHEGEGARGSCEIGTCIYKYLSEKVKNCENDIEIIFYSDNCSGQQKNKYLFSMYLYAVDKLPIKSITHNFLIKGHSQNEGDNVHAMIEKQIKKCLKSGPIYHPAQYISLIKTAKKTGNPYKVNELSHEDFLDFKDLWANIGCNSTVNVSGCTVAMNDIKIIKVEKDSPFKIKYKTTYDDTVDFQEIFIQQIDIEENEDLFGDNKKSHTKKKTRSSKKKQQVFPVHCSDVALKKLYEQRLGISVNKKKDLQYLLEKHVIPSCYAPFYNSL
ncbi:uncharacterized protein LOC124357786 [Homalodisca vitripennis]|uniref:uncharacterized protein LOC124357786 n=1 Tax=Homalodisca vitripennis TaxID=197043 RepID=UPI001EEC92BE|nr:uncharacterized protein LOC124357786 [Homalodisca vitripennis]